MIALLCALGLTALFVALLLYPGELSWLSPRGTRWLYDRGAQRYEHKWQRHDYTLYDTLIQQAAQSVESTNRPPRVLDLCCGTGRATLLAIEALGARASYTAVDFSNGMLASLRKQLSDSPQTQTLDINVIQADAQTWLENNAQTYDLLLLMEAGEFLPAFKDLMLKMGTSCNQGGTLVMTRPAGLWCLFFPGRAQTRTQLSALLIEAGFSDISFSPWRRRYELVQARKG